MTIATFSWNKQVPATDFGANGMVVIGGREIMDSTSSAETQKEYGPTWKIKSVFA